MPMIIYNPDKGITDIEAATRQAIANNCTHIMWYGNLYKITYQRTCIGSVIYSKHATGDQD